MDHGGEAARPTTVGSTELGMPGAVRGSETNIGSGTFDGSFSAVAGRGEVPVDVLSHLQQESRPGVAYLNIVGEFWRQMGLVEVTLQGPHLPGGVVPVHNYGYYSALQARLGARRGVVLVHLLPGGGAVYNGDYSLQPRPGAGHGEVPVDLLPDGAGHGEAFVGHLPGGGVPAYDDYGYYPLQPRPGAGHDEVLVDMLPDGAGHGEQFIGLLQGGGAAFDDYVYYARQPRPGAGHGEVLVDMLPDGAGHGEQFIGLLQGGGAAFDHYVYYALQPRPGAGHGEVLVDMLPDGAGHGELFVGGLLPGSGGTLHNDYGYHAWQPRLGAGYGEVLPDGVGVVFDGSGNFARQTLRDAGTRGADGIAGALRGRNLGEGYDNRGVVAEHLRRLLPFAGIGVCSVAVNGLAAGAGSPVTAFHFFVLLLGGLFLIILHVLRV